MSIVLHRPPIKLSTTNATNLKTLMASKSEPEKTASLSEKDAKAPNLLERAKEEIEAVFHTENSPSHDKETHGRVDDIDKTTSVDDVKAPGVLQRAKEEVEALVDAINPKK